MFEVGRLCVKIAGRDAGQKCVIVDVEKDGFVLIDGLTRRRKCNIKHLEPLKTTLKISKGASHDVVAKEFDALGMKLLEKKSKKPTQRQKKQHVSKKAVKASAKKEAKPAKKEGPKEKAETPKIDSSEKKVAPKKSTTKKE